MRSPIAVALVTVLLLSACQTVSTPGGDSTPRPMATPTGSSLPSAEAEASADPTRPATSPAGGAPTPGPSPSPSPTTSPAAPSQSPAAETAAIYLSGPFGSLDGTATTGDASLDPDDLRPLDQYAQGADLDIGFRDRRLEFLGWIVTASPVGGDPLEATELGVGPAPGGRADLISLVGPQTGEWLLRLEAEVADSLPATYHWRLVVPDRDMPADGRLEVPAPDLLIDSDEENVTAELGAGCYVYSCGDLGGLTPFDRLPRVRSEDGSLRLGLSDDSGFVEWKVTGWPVRDDPDASRSFDEGTSTEGTARDDFSMPTGDWYLQVDITFDLERGQLSYFVRVTVD